MCAAAVKKMTMRFWETTQILPKREAGVNPPFSHKPYIHTTVFDFSWETVIPTRNWKQWFSKILGVHYGLYENSECWIRGGVVGSLPELYTDSFCFSLPTYPSANPTFCAKLELVLD